jgi:hypothetical protein
MNGSASQRLLPREKRGMAPELSRTVRQVAFALMALAAPATEVAAVDSRPM